MSATAFLDSVATRRSIYPLEAKSPISDARIQEIIKQAVLHVPSSFNSQSTRIVLLLKEEHVKFWDFTKEVLKAIVPEDAWSKTEGRMNMFQAGYGTVLFYVDRKVTQEFQNKFAIYADRFPQWATESGGMHQFAIWTALEAEGLGANLQHYNPLVDQKVAAEWKISESWELQAQLVIGTPSAPAGEKQFQPVEGERFLTFGA